jgi:hypothetical protein
MRIRLFSWKAVLIVLITVATAIVLAIYAVAVLYTIAQFQSDDKQYPPRDELQRYIVLGYPVNIPQGYRNWFEAAIRQSPRTPQPWVVDTVTNKFGLEIVYPTMAMPQEWDPGKVRPKVEGEEIVMININPVPGYGKSVLADMMQEQVEEGNCAVKKFGDTCADPYLPSASSQEMIYLGTKFDFAYCSNEDGQDRVPHCEMEFMLVDDIAVDFFSRAEF